ncbi:MAG: PAS domain S-box protein [Syntrophobacteraceae bacterium]
MWDKVLVRDPAVLINMSIGKGWFYVSVTALMLYVLISRDASRIKQSEKEARLSDAKYRELVESANSIIMRRDISGHITFFNEFAQDFFGYSKREVLGRNVIGTIVPEFDRSGRDLKEMIEDIGRHPERYTNNENENMRANGERVWIAWTNEPIRDAHGQITEILCIGNDITERKQADEALQQSNARINHLNDVLCAVRDVGSLINREKDPIELLNAVCNSLVQTRGYVMVWIGQPEADSKRVLPVAFSGGSGDFLQHAPITWDDSPTGQGPAGTAMRERRAVVFDDLATDPRFALWKDPVMSYGGASIASVPIIHDERLFGVLTVKADRPNAFDVEEVELLSNLAADLARALQSLENEAARKRAEEALSVRESYLTAILENQPGLVWLKDKDSRFLAVNQTFAQSCGMERPEEVLGKTDLDIWPRELAEKYRNDDKAVLTTGVPIAVEEAISDRGEMKWFETFKTPVLDNDGQILGTSGYARDITERKQAEEALLESENKFKSFAENALVGIYLLQDEVFKYVNPKFAQMFGYTVEELNDMSYKNLIHTEDLARVEEQLRKRVSGEIEYVHYTFRGLKKSGQSFHAELFASTSEHKGRPAATGTILDITERRHAEERVLRAKEDWERTFDAVPDLIAILDKDYRIVRVNKAMAAKLGLVPAECVGLMCYQAVHGTSEPPLFCPNRQLLRDGIEHTTEIYEERLGGDFVLSVSPLLGPVGELIGSVHICHDITERKNAEKALYESEFRLRTILQTANEGFWLIDNDNVTTDLNLRMCAILGRNREEVFGRKIFDFVDSENKAIFEHQIRLRAQGEVGAYEIALSRPDGSNVLCQFNATPLFDGSGNKVGSFAMVTDISERKRAEEALRESEELYRTLVSLSPDAISVLDLNGLLIFTSPKARQMFGDSPDDDILGRNILSWVAPEEHERVSTNIKRLLTEGTLAAAEYTLVKKDGTRFIGEVNAAVIYSPGGSPMSMIAITRDITERKQAEDTLRQSEDRFSRFFRASPISTSITRLSDGQFVDINDAFLGLSGYTRVEIVGQDSLRLGIWANPEERPKMVKTLEEQGRVQDFETRFRRKSGEIKDVLVSAEVIEVAGQQYMLGLTNDITERKRGEEQRKKLEEQLFQSQKMESVGRLAGGVAHDFNNMLGVIIGRTELALRNDVSLDNIQHHLDEILKAGLRSAALTRQLLAFARKQTAIPKILDLNDTISGMLKMLHRLIGEDIDLLWAPELNLWKVKIDPSQVDQILANLAVNARDAISGVGAVTVRTENVVIDDSNWADTPEFIPGDYVLLIVSDTGTGMSQEVRENIFEPFFTTKEVGKGTGLGLSTVYGIVKQNEGFIYVESEPGKGTTFKIYLPRFEAETAHVPSEHVAVERPTGTETILLVEDDESILDLGKIILDNLGYTVLVAHTPVYALHLVEDHPEDIHLLITDVVMPQMHGRELAERLRVIRPNLKCLYMSGYTADAIAHRGILDEGVNFIQKPFRGDDLAAKVRQVLDLSE